MPPVLWARVIPWEKSIAIAALESGASDRYLGEEGVPGAVKASKDCMRDPICLAYLKMIRDRVYARWQLPSSIAPGEVRLRFQIDRGGSAHGLRLVATDDSHLGDTCLAAFRHASPFPPPPREIEYLVGDARNLSTLGLTGFDAATCIMALGNIDPIEEVSRIDEVFIKRCMPFKADQ